VTQISVRVDGASYTDDVEPRTLLVHYLREQLGKVGTVVGCDTSNCGACTVHLDGEAVKSCTVLAVQADGSEVTTIEGISQNGSLHPMQKAFHEMHGLQCGFCTPGMIMASIDLVNDNPNPATWPSPSPRCGASTLDWTLSIHTSRRPHSRWRGTAQRLSSRHCMAGWITPARPT